MTPIKKGFMVTTEGKNNYLNLSIIYKGVVLLNSMTEQIIKKVLRNGSVNKIIVVPRKANINVGDYVLIQKIDIQKLNSTIEDGSIRQDVAISTAPLYNETNT